MIKKRILGVLVFSIAMSCLASFTTRFENEKENISTSTQKTINSVGMEMILIPAGYFYMGSEGKGINADEAPIHKVTISKSFSMGATEVTNAQYELFDPEHKKLRGQNGLSKLDNEAVIFVSYQQAVAFCDWLSKKEGRPYRLPTEAEWEYAARAGTTWNYSMDDGLPASYQKNQKTTWGVDSTVDLSVKSSPANPFGLYDMHGNVEEWCFDWYGLYTSESQTDPVGRVDGNYRVTRGGSHSTPVEFLRSANRMAMIPEDKHWLTGFRVVQGEMPTTTPLPEQAPSTLSQDVSQEIFQWGDSNSEAFFDEPIPFVRAPTTESNVPFYDHNHCPAITYCENGDLLAIWFTTNDEAGREMTILGSRLREGNQQWDEPSEFFRVPDRNVTGSSLYHDAAGTLIHTNGMEAAGSWQTLAMVMRTSTDNGATWTKPKLINKNHQVRNQVIAGMIKTKEGWLIQPADATPWGDGGTAIHLSKDGGKTWLDPGTDSPDAFKEGGKGGSIAGIHAGVVQLENGDLMALGRGNSIVNRDGLDRMPMSISSDYGKTWTYAASEFPPIDGGQRLVLRRLNEGPLLFISFTNHPYRLKNNQSGMKFTLAEKEFTGYGMFAALSFDEGKTWPIKKLLTDGDTRFLNGGAWTGYFEMDGTHAEPRGYLAATQTPDQVIHLLSSSLYYRLNLLWLLEGSNLNFNNK